MLIPISVGPFLGPLVESKERNRIRDIISLIDVENLNSRGDVRETRTQE